jgi:hypothetical protein
VLVKTVPQCRSTLAPARVPPAPTPSAPALKAPALTCKSMHSLLLFPAYAFYLAEAACIIVLRAQSNQYTSVASQPGLKNQTPRARAMDALLPELRSL